MPSARFIAFTIVSPNTNCRPISRIARATAVRMTGSPSRLIAPRRWPVSPDCWSSRTRPVSINAQVDAFTSEDAEWPRCLPQSDGAILSSISASIVKPSGTRNRASARHINAMPSSVDRPYSARKTSISPASALFLIWRTKSAPLSAIRLWSSGVSSTCSTKL